MDGELLLLGDPRDKSLIEGEEELRADAYGRGQDVRVFSTGDRCCGFLLRSTWYGSNDKRDFEDLLSIAGTGQQREVGEDVALGFCQYPVGDSASQESPSTDRKQQTAAARWGTGSSNQAGAIEKHKGRLGNRHLEKY